MTQRFPTNAEATAYSVYLTLNDFVDRFHEQATELNPLAQILDGTRFRGGVVGQQPEYFTEEALIVPLLESLGYEGIRWRPHNLIKEERNQPDLLIQDSPRAVTAIVESKRLGREHDTSVAQDQAAAYLRDDTFVKYATDREKSYLVGFGTDGITWSLIATPIGGGAIQTLGQVSILDPLRAIVRIRRSMAEPPSRVAQVLRSELEPFSELCGKWALEGHLEAAFET
jgi:hypothetical protein